MEVNLSRLNRVATDSFERMYDFYKKDVVEICKPLLKKRKSYIASHDYIMNIFKKNIFTIKRYSSYNLKRLAKVRNKQLIESVQKFDIRGFNSDIFKALLSDIITLNNLILRNEDRLAEFYPDLLNFELYKKIYNY